MRAVLLFILKSSALAGGDLLFAFAEDIPQSNTGVKMLADIALRLRQKLVSILHYHGEKLY